MIDNIYKYPRLYLNVSLKENESVALDTPQNHYLKNVLRKNVGDIIRVFNGVEGEWVCEISALGKKSGEGVLKQCLKRQPNFSKEIALYFAPIKKQRMDILIEKAVELGVTDLHPVLTNRTEYRKLNEGRMSAQIIEASEQCERLTIPKLHTIARLSDVLIQNHDVPFYACLERDANKTLISDCDFTSGVAFLIGPVGGFDDDEVARILSCEDVIPLSLGNYILRAETAAIMCMSYACL